MPIPHITSQLCNRVIQRAQLQAQAWH